MQDFRDKLAVVTGGASGVGRSLAFALGAEGARVLIADVDRVALETTRAALAERGVDAHERLCDVTQSSQVQELARVAFDELGGASLVFANAGIGAGEAGPMWSYAIQDWQWGFNVNVWGVIHTINAFMPRLVSAEVEAHMVITGSGNGAFIVYPDQPIYTATKAAVQAITESLYYQLRAAGSPVKVNALFPGPHVVETGIFDSDRVRPRELARPPGMPDSGIRSADDLKRLMEQHGLTLETTHPDTVARAALAGLRDEKFWICEMTDETKTKVRRRFDSILTGSDPEAPHLG